MPDNPQAAPRLARTGLRPCHLSFRSVLNAGGLVRVAGAHTALGAVIAEQAGFGAVWASSFEISAARCLPDASLLSMNEYLRVAAEMQKVLSIPVIADCDTGYGNNLNVAHMVTEYAGAGITAVCIEDQTFPKINSYADTTHDLLDITSFASKLTTAKESQPSPDFFVIARTEALIAGRDVAEALRRCRAYADAGADSVLVHSKSTSHDQVAEFLDQWDGRVPVTIVPTTYSHWHADEAARAGVSVVIYANQGLRTIVKALQGTYAQLLKDGCSAGLDDQIASVREVFDLQHLDAWQGLQR